MSSKTTVFLSNTVLKVVAFVIGYVLWSMLSNLYVIQARYTVPVFIHAHALSVEEQPKSAHITLRGLRSDLRSIDKETLAIHISEDQLKSGSNTIAPQVQHLGLPSRISLVQCTPVNFVVVAAKKSTSNQSANSTQSLTQQEVVTTQQA